MIIKEEGIFFISLLFSQTRLLLSLSLSKPGIVRITIDEFQPIKARYRVPDVLSGEPQCEQ